MPVSKRDGRYYDQDGNRVAAPDMGLQGEQGSQEESREPEPEPEPTRRDAQKKSDDK